VSKVADPLNDPRLAEAMGSFERLDTADLIFEATLHTGDFADNADAKKQMAPVIGASYALNKVLYYLDALDRAEGERLAVGKEIAAIRGEADRVGVGDPVEATRLDFRAFTLAGRQEVAWHQFTGWVGQIARLLEAAAAGPGTEVAVADRAYLDTFRVLRNHFEHLDERLPGAERGGRLVIPQADLARVALGLQRDAMGRVVGGGTAVDVTTRGRDEVRRVVARTVEAIRAACLARLRAHFEARPGRIPRPDEIGGNLSRTLG
jgi:hypothetical protein